MPRKMGIGELLRAVSLQKTKQAKIDLLLNNKTGALAKYFQHVFDPRIVFLLPKDIDYMPAVGLVDGPLAFLDHIRRLYIFCAGGNDLISQAQRESIFVNMLQTIDPLDAEAAVAMKDKKLPFNVPRKLIEEAFPGFLPEEEKKPTVSHKKKPAPVEEPVAGKAAPTSTSSLG